MPSKQGANMMQTVQFIILQMKSSQYLSMEECFAQYASYS